MNINVEPRPAWLIQPGDVVHIGGMRVHVASVADNGGPMVAMSDVSGRGYALTRHASLSVEARHARGA